MIHKKNTGSIKQRLTSIIMLVTFLTSIIGYSAFIYWFINEQYNRKVELIKTVSSTISQDVVKLILLNKVSVGADISSKLKSFKDLESLVLYRYDDEAIFQYSKFNKSFVPEKLPPMEQRDAVEIGDKLKLYTESAYQGNHLGFIQAVFRIDSIVDIIQKDIKLLLSILVLLFFLAYFLAITSAKHFTEPILKLVSFLEDIVFLDSLDKRIYTKEKNEYGKLYDEINTMLQRMEKAAKDQKLAAVAFEIQSGMIITDANHKILRVNKAFSEISGYSAEEVIGKTPAILNSQKHSKEFYENMYLSLEHFNYWHGEIYNKHKNGTIYPEQLTIQSVLDNNKPIYYIASFVDISLQKSAEEKVEYLKQYDTLTGLCNRNLFVENIQMSFQNRKESLWSALISFDIKDFKMINDAYGHLFGDKFLQEITKRLEVHFQKNSNLMGRIGGDEFVLWFQDLTKNREEAMQKSKAIAQDIIKVLSVPFLLDEKIIHAKAFVGVTLYNDTKESAHTLLKQSDLALHKAKLGTSSQNIAFFDIHTEDDTRFQLDTQAQILDAIEKHQFELYYQLQYNDKEEIYGAEALIRWNHPKKGLVFPDEFIPIAERTGSILPMGDWIIEAGCRQLALWQKNDRTKDWVLAINISAYQFKQENFLKNIKTIAKDFQIDYTKLKLELTESIVVDDLDKIIQKMDALRDFGFKISLDDFGTGYSSLQYLKKLPLDQIKIDQSFVRFMFENKNDVAIVKSVLQLGKDFGVEVITEGVESREHFEKLKELGCKLYQGYYFAKPKSIHDINMELNIS